MRAGWWLPHDGAAADDWLSSKSSVVVPDVVMRFQAR